MGGVLDLQYAKELVNDELFKDTILVYYNNSLFIRNQIQNPKDVIYPAPILEDFINAIEKKFNENYYFYLSTNRIALPKNASEAYQVYIGNFYWWSKKGDY